MSYLLPDRPACWSWPTGSMPDECTFDDMAIWQAGRCAVCGSYSDWHLDHDHESGLVRGWLCNSCNYREGSQKYRDHHVFVNYRAYPPAAILGISVPYATLGSTKLRLRRRAAANRAKPGETGHVPAEPYAGLGLVGPSGGPVLPRSASRRALARPRPRQSDDKTIGPRP